MLGAGLWGGLAFIYAGGWLLAGRAGSVGMILLFTGVTLTVLSAWLLLRANQSLSLLLTMAAVRISGIMLEALRMLLAVTAFGIGVGLDQTSTLVVASFLGSLVAIAPAGFGVRELAVSLVSPLIGIEPQVGFLAATLNRLVGMTGLAIASLLLFRMTKVE